MCSEVIELELRWRAERLWKCVVLGTNARTPNDLKLSDGGVRRGTCMVGGKAAAEAGAVTHGAVRCSAWLGRGSWESLRESVVSRYEFVSSSLWSEQSNNSLMSTQARTLYCGASVRHLRISVGSSGE